MISAVDVKSYCRVRIDNVIRAVIDFKNGLRYAGLISKASDKESLQRPESVLVDTVLALLEKVIHPFCYLLIIHVRDLEKKSLEI